MNAQADSYVHILMSFGEKNAQLLTKLYALKASLLSQPFSPHLSDVNLAKIRFTVDRKFPVLVDLSQSSGFASLMNVAGEIISNYDSVVRVIREVSVHMNLMLSTLKSAHIFNIDLNFNRAILFAWIEAFSSYVKILLFLEKMPEAGPMILLFFAAKSVAGSLKQANASASDFAWFKRVTVNIRRHFIDEFTPLQCIFLHLINNVKDVVNFYFDARSLRELFDPTNCDIELSGYHLTVLGKRSCYMELCNAPRYAEFIVFCVLACPALLFDEEVLDLLHSVTERVFIISLFRDITINVHKEFEAIYSFYPTDQDSGVKVPNNFKISTQLKNLSRQSVSVAGRNQAIRRRLLMHFLQDNINFIKVLPGVISAKSIIIVIACSWLNEEVSIFCQHFPPFSCRKDTKSFLDNELYMVDDLGSALKMLHETIALLSASWELIQSFYKEYVLDIDFPLLSQFLEQHRNLSTEPSLQHSLSHLQQGIILLKEQQLSSNVGNHENSSIITGNHLQKLLLDAMNAISYRGSLDAIPSVAISSSTNATVAAAGGNNKPGPTGTIRSSLLPAAATAGMRSSVMGAPVMSVAAAQLSVIPDVEAVDDSAYILSTIWEHVTFGFFSLTSNLIYSMDPFRVAWYRDALQQCFQKSLLTGLKSNSTIDAEPESNLLSSLTTTSSSSYSPFFAYFHPFETTLLNVHSQCGEEATPLMENAVTCSEQMITQLVDTIVSLFKQMWGKYAQLDMQVHPNELIKRLEVMVQQSKLMQYETGKEKLTLIHQSLGILPGFESELWAEESMTEFMLTQKKLYQLLHAVKKKPFLRICKKEFTILDEVRQKLREVFVDKCHLLKRQVPDTMTLLASLTEAAALGESTVSLHQQARFSVLVWRFEIGSKLLQQCFQFLGEDVGLLGEANGADDEVNVANIIREIKQREIFGMDVSEEVEAILQQVATSAADRNDNPNDTTAIEKKHMSLGQVILQQNAILNQEYVELKSEDKNKLDDASAILLNESMTKQQENYIALGIPVPLDHHLPEDSLAEALCDWFDVLVMQCLSSSSSPWVYLPYQQNFVHFTRLKHLQQLSRYQQQQQLHALQTQQPSQYVDPAPYFPPSDLLIEILLQPAELLSLVTFIGVYGVRLLEGRLCAIFYAQMKDIIDIVERNNKQLEVLEKDYCFSITSVQSLEGMESLVSALRTMGIALAVRKMILSAVGKVAKNVAPDLHEYLTSLQMSLDPHCHSLASTTSRIAFYGLTHSLGIACTATPGSNENLHQIADFDFAMFESLITTGLTVKDLSMLQKLPILASGLIAHRTWDAPPKLKYHVDYEVFETNEHLISQALVTTLLFSVNLAEHMKQAVVIPGLSTSATEHGGLSSLFAKTGSKSTAVSEVEMLGMANETVLQASMVQNVAIDPIQLRMHKEWLRQQTLRSVLRFSLQLLLTRKERENPMNVSEIPFAALWMLLRTFVTAGSPIISMQHLQEFTPYDLIHHMSLDISLGKVRGKDILHAFNALPVESDEQLALHQEYNNPQNNSGVDPDDL